MELCNRFLANELVAACLVFLLAHLQHKSVTTSFVGFQFMNTTLILVAVAFVILCVSTFITTAIYEGVMKVKTLWCTTPLIASMVALGIFLLSVSSQGGERAVPGRPYKEYRVESYSRWMQNKVRANWDTYYEKAVVENKDFVCAEYDFPPLQFEVRADPAFKSGCCKAPRGCKLCSFFNNQTSSSTRSIKLENGEHCSDDCNRWDDDPNTLCFNCQSCKAGLLQDLTKSWFSTGLLLIIIGVILLWVQIKGILKYYY